MVKRYKGGLLSSTEASTSVSSASSMWNMSQATQARRAGNWPALLVTETPGSGGAPSMTVSNVAVTDGSYTVLDDTPYISTAGGYIKVTGTGFASGCVVYVGGTAATSTTFVSSTEVRAVVPAASSNTLMVYVVNPNGSTAIKLNSLIFSGTPTWGTAETLSTQIAEVAFSVQLSASSNSSITYTLAVGSSLPPGTSLSSGGVFSGTVTGLNNDTTYSFSVVATDAENQDTSRTFSVTVSVGDTNFYLTPVLLNAEGNIWIKDSSSNGFTSTVVGDTRPTAFSPYNTSWSGYFDGGADYITVAGSSNLAFGTNDWTIEYFIYLNATTQGLAYDARPSGTAASDYIQIYGCNGVSRFSFVVAGATRIQSDNTVVTGRWYHFVLSRVSGVTRMFVDGVVQASTYTDSINYLNGASRPLIGANGGNSVGAEPLNGYISNLRVLNGTGYTSVTVPTSTLTAIANTQLLTLQNNRFIDNSANAYTITKTNDAAIKSFGPFGDTDTITGSGYFDGTGDYLTLTGSANLAFGTSDFTIEHFVYFNSIASEQITYDGRASGAASGAQPCIIMNGTSKLITYYVNGAVRISSDAAMTAGQWYHIVISRVSSVTRMFINGTQQTGTYSDTTSYTNPANRPVIGAYADSLSSGYMNGYISDLRVRNGTGATSVTVPTTTSTAVVNTQLLTLQYRVSENSHRFVDEAGLKYIITRTGEVHQGTFSPFSPAGWSGYFNGTADSLTVPAGTDFAYGTGDFTVEGWFYATSTLAAYGSMLWSQVASGHNYFLVAAGEGASPVVNNYIQFVGAASGGGTPIYSSTVFTLNSWNHFAVVRISGSVRVYLNGVGGTATSNTTDFNNTSYVPNIGRYTDGTSWFPGYISNLRVVKGVGVYTGNFTPPTTALTATQSSGSNIAAITAGQTSFLALQNNRFVDNSATPKTITRGGGTRIHAFSPFRAGAAYSPTVHSGSAYFDGSGDYLDVTGSTSLAFSTNDWTIEFWLYTENVTGDKILYDARPASTNGAYPTIYQSSATIKYYTSSADRITSSTTITATTWNHIAVARISGTTRMYINGIVQTATYTDSTTYLNGASRPRLGDSGVTAGAGLAGYISGLRVVNGQGIFTGNFTVPTAPPGTSQTLSTNVAAMIGGNLSLLTNFTHSGIIDHTGRYNIYTYTGTNIRSSNVQSKFGGGSIFFTGSYQWLFIGPGNTSAYPPLLPTIGDFTAECWIYPTAGDITLMALNTNPSATAAVRVSLNANGTIGLLSSTNGSTFAINATSGNVLNYNAWQHFAVVRNGGNIIVYHNGTAVITSTAVSATTALMAGSESMLGGLDFRNNVDFISFYNGYIDDFRVTRLARYTANFTPTTTAFLTR